MPIIAGGKVNGRAGNANFGGLVIGTDDRQGVVEDEALMAVGRVKENLWRESWVGAIATFGDPLGRSGRWLTGADFTYATSRFRGDKNFLVGVWGLVTRPDLWQRRRVHRLQGGLPERQMGHATDLQADRQRFRSRDRVRAAAIGATDQRRPRQPDAHRLRPAPAARHEFEPFVALDLNEPVGELRVFFAPLNWRFRSGDRVEFNLNPTGERLVAPFEVSDGVVIAPGSYHWRQYRLEAGTAQKRRLYRS